MDSVAIIDYGMGNLHSIAKAVQHAGPNVRIEVTDRPEQILAADRVIFPGVGAMRDCMAQLSQRGLVEVLKEAAERRPFLGICLGMQALLDQTEENGGTATLGLIQGEVLRFPEGQVDARGHRLKIPHMGWNRVMPTQAHPIWAGIPQGSWFYFVHSYYAQPRNPAHVAATTDYPGPFASAVADGPVVAVQFHPEKSQALGLKLLANFLAWSP